MHYKKSHFLLLRYSHFKYLQTHAIKDYNLNYTPARPRIDQTVPLNITNAIDQNFEEQKSKKLCMLATYI